MRKSFVSGLILLFSIASPVALANSMNGVHEYQPYHYSVTKDTYKLSELYQINPQLTETYVGTIKKSAFRIRTNYDLSNKEGWQATGITRILSLGSFYHWAKDIDIYDTRGVQIGLIDGNLATLESAKFNIYEYDESGNSTEIGTAYSNPDFSRFVILESANDPHPIAEMNRDFSNGTWSVSVYYPEKIDDRIMRIFSGFVIDHEDKFLSNKD